MLMTKKCISVGCENQSTKKETYKVLDDKFQMYTFKVTLCDDCFVKIHEIKEKVIGDFSVFFSVPIKKTYK
jgi:hypothetical protein